MVKLYENIQENTLFLDKGNKNVNYLTSNLASDIGDGVISQDI